ncbi:RDD family protein [Carboxylicivirga mesophila]|uniref:RDD family protein n=1 Tax=Carboxylicivirga mesophila TaxID=1166478 RepID=A0ABS5K6E4_9BACT|nr:RDD family protein [Carboxylicivirga mesophila]
MIDGIIAILLFFLTINIIDLNQSNLFLQPSQNLVLQFSTGMVSVILYFAIIEATTGRTIGKIITHTKVVNTCGRKPSFKSIIMRSLLRVIPLDVLSFLIAHTDGWHDRWSKTTVITT